jgi:hypothetical protein
MCKSRFGSSACGATSPHCSTGFEYVQGGFGTLQLGGMLRPPRTAAVAELSYNSANGRARSQAQFECPASCPAADSR